MVTIVTRSGKGSPLTNSEVDSNFTNLNSGKLETSGGSVTGNLTVSGSSATDLVRITQTGAGNALVVEDSTNPDSSPFVVDASGNVGIGVSVPTSTLHVAGTLYATGTVQIDGLATVNNAISLGPAGGEGGEIRFVNPTGGANGMIIDVQANDVGRIFSASNNFALVIGQVAGTGGYTAFWTETSEKMRLIANGNFGIGTTAPGSKLDVKGTLRLSGSTSGYVGLAPAAAAGSTVYTLPSADGTNGQVLSTNGAGTLTWATASSGGATTGRLVNVQVFTTAGSNTYTRSSGVTSAVAIVVGGGGGGGGDTGNGASGGTTSFGSHVSAAGGSGGVSSSGGGTPGAGGTGGSGATIAIKGAPGTAGTLGAGTADYSGGGGGQGGGAQTTSVSSGNAGVRGGGGGGRKDGGYMPSGGGGQGETCIKYITAVGSSETVTVGSGGTGGSTGGGAGGAGYAIVYEYS